MPKTRIFLIDDISIVLKSMECLFKQVGFEVTTFTNPIEGLDAVEKYKPELVFLDFLMPEIKGDEFMIQFSERKLFTDTKVYLLTSQMFSNVERMTLMTLGFSDILQKPLSKAKLEEILEAEKFSISKKVS